MSVGFELVHCIIAVLGYGVKSKFALFYGEDEFKMGKESHKM